MSAAGHVLYTSELSGVDPERPDGEADLMVIRDHPMLTNERGNGEHPHCNEF